MADMGIPIKALSDSSSPAMRNDHSKDASMAQRYDRPIKHGTGIENISCHEGNKAIVFLFIDWQTKCKPAESSQGTNTQTMRGRFIKPH
jgi:hypothetical protein